MKSSVRLAFLCGLSPLVAGILVLIAYYFMDATGLESLGFTVIMAGVLLFLPVGLLSLIVHWVLGWMGKGDIARASWVALLILVLNFPAAYMCIVSAGRISDSRYRVTIWNWSGETLSELQLVTDSKRIALGELPTKQRLGLWFYVRDDDELSLEGKLGDESIKQVLVTDLKWGYLSVTIGPDGEIEAKLVDDSVFDWTNYAAFQR